jgi:putative transposase
VIRDDQWERIEQLLPGNPWRDLPEELGGWHTTYTRFSRWSKAGARARLAAPLSDADLEQLIIDSTIVRSHQHAAEAKNKRGVKPSEDRAGD